MIVNNQNQTLLDFIEKIRDKSSVFCYSDRSEAKMVLSLLTEEFRITRPSPVINIYWNENDDTILPDERNSTSFYMYRNFTSTLIKIEKLLSAKKHLVILADISTLPLGQESKPYIHFLMILLRKCDEYKSTILSIANEDDLNNDIVPFFANRFLLKGKRMKKADDPSTDFRYEANSNGLYLEPYTQSDINKLKEIFSLTPEEKEELDKLVGQSLEEYRTSM